MPQPFPHHYTAELEVKDDAASLVRAGDRAPLLGGNPPEFDGKPEFWSPEHLLLAGLQICFRGTFNALRARPGIAPRAFRTRAECKLEKTTAGIVFTEIKLHAYAEVPAAQVEATKELLAKSKKLCIFSNQLKTEPTLELDVKGF